MSRHALDSITHVRRSSGQANRSHRHVKSSKWTEEEIIRIAPGQDENCRPLFFRADCVRAVGRSQCAKLATVGAGIGRRRRRSQRIDEVLTKPRITPDYFAASYIGAQLASQSRRDHKRSQVDARRLQERRKSTEKTIRPSTTRGSDTPPFSRRASTTSTSTSTTPGKSTR